MKAKVTTLDNKAIGDIELAEEVFGIKPRRDILHRVVTWQLAKRRGGNHGAKERNAIRGSGAKIWRQKGTGRARSYPQVDQEGPGPWHAFGAVGETCRGQASYP